MKYEIEIEGLPEGWEPVCYRPANEGEYYLQNGVVYSSIDMTYPRIIVKKKQPRRLVLEETGEKNHLYESGQYSSFSAGGFVISGVRNKWREAKENDLSLNNEEPKLKMMAIEFKECSINGCYYVLYKGIKVGQICKYLSGEVLFSGFDITQIEQILTKMKELQNGKDNTISS